VKKLTEATVELPNGEVIEVDFSDMEKRIKANIDPSVKEAFEKYMKEKKEPRETGGRGVIETFMPQDKKKAILEELQKGDRMNHRLVTEQWTIAVPRYTEYETAAHLRDFIFVTDVVKGKAGQDVNIPYVKDVEFSNVVPMTGAIPAKTGLVNVLQTTLNEAGAYYDCYYGDIEKIDSNLLDELNRVMAHAAVRAEDWAVMNLCEAGTTDDFSPHPAAGASGNTWINVGDYNLVGSTFKIEWIADAIGKLVLKGKDVHPGELLLVLNPAAYVTLLKKLSATTNTAVAYARPDIWQKGLIEEYLGVRIVVSGGIMRSNMASGIGGGGTTYQVNFLMRPKRALALAPKRDILIETDKIIASRTLRIAATHTFGVAAIDLSEVVPIWSGVT